MIYEEIIRFGFSLTCYALLPEIQFSNEWSVFIVTDFDFEIAWLNLRSHLVRMSKMFLTQRRYSGWQLVCRRCLSNDIQQKVIWIQYCSAFTKTFRKFEKFDNHTTHLVKVFFVHLLKLMKCNSNFFSVLCDFFFHSVA